MSLEPAAVSRTRSPFGGMHYLQESLRLYVLRLFVIQIRVNLVKMKVLELSRQSQSPDVAVIILSNAQDQSEDKLNAHRPWRASHGLLPEGGSGSHLLCAGLSGAPLWEDSGSAHSWGQEQREAGRAHGDNR